MDRNRTHFLHEGYGRFSQAIGLQPPSYLFLVLRKLTYSEIEHCVCHLRHPSIHKAILHYWQHHFFAHRQIEQSTRLGVP